MRIRFRGAAGAVVCVALAAGGCTTTRTGAPTASADEAVGRCVAATVGGAIVGTLIGAAAAGSRGAAVGAVVGGATGGVGCAVLTALDAQDRERIRAAQIAAAATNQPRYLAYAGGPDRVQRRITVRPQPAPARTAENGGRLCRATDTSVSIDGQGAAELPRQIVCRTPDGAWVQQAG